MICKEVGSEFLKVRGGIGRKGGGGNDEEGIRTGEEGKRLG
ncbi:hypothetical protein [Staphylococcus epidermidis]|nr:hypothetical protein [Staphylococcus epidermidis]